MVTPPWRPTGDDEIVSGNSAPSLPTNRPCANLSAGGWRQIDLLSRRECGPLRSKAKRPPLLLALLWAAAAQATPRRPTHEPAERDPGAAPGQRGSRQPAGEPGDRRRRSELQHPDRSAAGHGGAAAGAGARLQQPGRQRHGGAGLEPGGLVQHPTLQQEPAAGRRGRPHRVHPGRPAVPGLAPPGAGGRQRLLVGRCGVPAGERRLHPHQPPCGGQHPGLQGRDQGRPHAVLRHQRIRRPGPEPGARARPQRRPGRHLGARHRARPQRQPPGL